MNWFMHNFCLLLRNERVHIHIQIFCCNNFPSYPMLYWNFCWTPSISKTQRFFFWCEIGQSSDDYLKPLRGPLKSGDYELSVDFELNAREERKHMTHKDLHMTSVDLKSILGVKRYTVEDKIAFTMKDKIEEARNAVVNKAELEKKKYNTNEIRCLPIIAYFILLNILSQQPILNSKSTYFCLPNQKSPS